MQQIPKRGIQARNWLRQYVDECGSEHKHKDTCQYKPTQIRRVGKGSLTCLQSHSHKLFYFARSTDSYCEPRREKAPWRATISVLLNKSITYSRPTPPLYLRYFSLVRPTQEGVLCKWRWRVSDHLSSTRSVEVHCKIAREVSGTPSGYP